MRAIYLPAGALLSMFGATASPATVLIGSLTDTYLYPNATSAYATSTLTVGTTVSCPGADPICKGTFVEPTTLLASGLAITLNELGGTNYSTAAFSGINFSNLLFDDGSLLTGYSLSTNLAGLDASRIAFTSNSISFNGQGLAFLNSPYFITLNLLTSTGAVPEPSTWAMMLMGFGGLGFQLRRKRKTAALLQAA